MSELKPNLYVAVAYRLYTKNQEGKRELVEEATKEQPFQFVSGLGMTLDDFEAHITPLPKDAEFDFELTPEQAYGEYEQERVIKVPRSTFEIDGRLDKQYIYEGAVVPLQNADGQRFNGLIAKIGDEEVTVDLNHPLAGKTLIFVGEVTDIREATPDEITRTLKIITGEGGCGCGCEDCGGCDDHHHEHSDHCGCGHCHG
ncbi:MAG: FKBP-type peptidyl-prolyl cis-trans isomerase [Bacteroidaceae bacterium]|nr:FKBP-type peptidyl-prolyl cis-trans isomerase [Bacteroidaceae bacterium]